MHWLYNTIYIYNWLYNMCTDYITLYIYNWLYNWLYNVHWLYNTIYIYNWLYNTCTDYTTLYIYNWLYNTVGDILMVSKSRNPIKDEHHPHLCFLFFYYKWSMFLNNDHISCNPTPRYISRKTLIWKDTCTPMFIAALFTVA